MAKQLKDTSSNLFDAADRYKRLWELDPENDIKKRTYLSLLSKAEDALTSELVIRGMKFQERAEGSDWWEVVKHMYRIIERDGKFVLMSEARDWNNEKSWEYDNKYLAWAHIERLVVYKNQDRRAGKGNRDADFERVDQLIKQRQAQLA